MLRPIEKKNGTIIENNLYNHATITANKMAEIINKFKNEYIEINLYLMEPGYHFYFRPPTEADSVKSYYILEGSLYNYDTKRVYGQGDLVILEAGNQPFSLKSETNVKVLVQSVHDNSYEKANDNFRIMNEALEKIEAKDAYTRHHVERVYALARLMGIALHYNGQEFRNLLHAAQYHDIGKVAIEDAILNKPGRLTDSEMNQMKTHVEKGRELVLSCFTEMVYAIVAQHHERLDGSGYPNGLKTDQISQTAKILAICDSFDAMITEHAYKEAMSPEAAIKELKALSGIEYDKKLVRVFIDEVIPKYL